MRQEQRRISAPFFFLLTQKRNVILSDLFDYLRELLLALSPSFCDLNPTYKVQPRQPV